MVFIAVENFESVVEDTGDAVVEVVKTFNSKTYAEDEVLNLTVLIIRQSLS